MKKKATGAGIVLCLAVALLLACRWNPGFAGQERPEGTGGSDSDIVADPNGGSQQDGVADSDGDPQQDGVADSDGGLQQDGVEDSDGGSQQGIGADTDGAGDPQESGAGGAAQSQEAQSGAGGQTEPRHKPEVTFLDYSQDIQDDGSGALLLSVTENCPVISIPENEAAAERMNLVFSQRHEANQADIQSAAESARKEYEGMSEAEKKDFTGYSYGVSYKMTYASKQVLSIVEECFSWGGDDSGMSMWSMAYCFDCASGELLSLSDVFDDVGAARKIVERHILDTVTSEEYKDGLLDDYESYVPDVLTENVFYLDKDGIVVLCNPGMVTSPDLGVLQIKVPYAELEGTLAHT